MFYNHSSYGIIKDISVLKTSEQFEIFNLKSSSLDELVELVTMPIENGVSICKRIHPVCQFGYE